MQLSVSGLSQRYGRWGGNLWFASLIFLLLPVYLGFYNTAAIPALKIGLLALSFTAYLLLALKIYILDGHSKKELLLYSLVLALITLGVVFSGTRSLFSVFLLALGAKDVPFSKIAKVCLGFFAGVLVLNGILVLTGVLEDTLVIRGEAWGYGNVRHTLGFGYPNTLALWFMLAVFALLLRPKKGVYPWLPALALSLAAFALTDSKAAFFSSLLALLLWAPRLLRPGAANLRRFPVWGSCGLWLGPGGQPVYLRPHLPGAYSKFPVFCPGPVEHLPGSQPGKMGDCRRRHCGRAVLHHGV